MIGIEFDKIQRITRPLLGSMEDAGGRGIVAINVGADGVDVVTGATSSGHN